MTWVLVVTAFLCGVYFGGNGGNGGGGLTYTNAEDEYGQ